MTKKKYQKPGMQVYPMMLQASLLAGSPGDGSGDPKARRFGSPWDDEEE